MRSRVVAEVWAAVLDLPATLAALHPGKVRIPRDLAVGLGPAGMAVLSGRGGAKERKRVGRATTFRPVFTDANPLRLGGLSQRAPLAQQRSYEVIELKARSAFGPKRTCDDVRPRPRVRGAYTTDPINTIIGVGTEGCLHESKSSRRHRTSSAACGAWRI